MSKEQTKQEEAKAQDTLPKVLGSFPNAPSSEQIEAWKVQYGEVFVSGFSETDLYIWRALTRPEYVNLDTIASNPETQIDRHKFEEMVCDACVLWKSIDKPWSEGKAGTPTSLQEQILQHSNFLNPQAAALLVAKL